MAACIALACRFTNGLFEMLKNISIYSKTINQIFKIIKILISESNLLKTPIASN